MLAERTSDPRTFSAPFTCTSCGFPSTRAHEACPRCHHWSAFKKVQASGPVPLSNFRGERIVRISAGLDFLDDLLGGGLVEGTLTFFAGTPGAGKSRIALLASSGLPVYYVAAEESAKRISARCDEMGVDYGKIQVHETEDLRAVEAHLLEVGRIYCFAVVDSFSCVRYAETGEDEVARARVLRNIARETGTPIVAVSHANADGEMRGQLSTQHEGDATICLTVDRERGVRMFETTKNRFGPVPVLREAVLEKEGFTEWCEPDPEEDADDE